MGNQHITYVFQNDEVKGADRLMLLAIADYCDEHGSCYPSYKTLAKKCNVDRRNAISTCQRLESDGHIYISKNDGYVTAKGQTNRFFMLKWRESVGLDNSEFTGDANVTSDAHITPLVMPTSPLRGDAHITQSQVVSQEETKDYASTDADAPPTPKKTATPESDNAYELSKVIPELLNLHNGREWNIAHMLSGTSKKKGYREYAGYFEGEKMVTPDELAKVVRYYKKQMPDTPIIQSPEIVADWVGKYRAHQAKVNEAPRMTYQEIWDFSHMDEPKRGGS